MEIQNVANVNFQLTPTLNTVKGFTLTLSKVGAVQIPTLSVNYIASIYLNMYTYMGDFDFNTNIVSTVGATVTASKTFNYVKPFNSSTQTRQILAFITGFKRTFANPADTNNKFSIFLNVQQNGSNFKIDFICNDINYSSMNSIQRVSFNYIEWIEEKTDPYSKAAANLDLTYLSITTQNIGNSPGAPRQDQHTISQFLMNSITSIFSGLSGIQASTSSDYLRMQIENQSISTFSLTLGYKTSGLTLIEGVIAGLLQFGVMICSNNTPSQYYHDYNQQCVDACSTLEQLQKLPGDSREQCVVCANNCKTCFGSEEDNCILCQPPYNYLLINQCFSSEPENSYCDPFTFQCKECTDSNCSHCDPILSVCKVCKSTFYIYNHTCHLPPPAETYCDNTKMECKDCLAECKSCSDGISCDSCEPNRKFYKNQCPAICPTTTYSDASNICQKCPSECTSCTSPTICQSCMFGYYWYKLFCYKVLPPHTYCDTSLNCFDCGPLCNTCSIISTKCDSCYAKAPYLFEQNCYGTQPAGTGCPKAPGGLYYICSTCPSKCGTCNENLECLSCSTGSPYLYRQDCFTAPPLGAYCDSVTKNCMNCPSACVGCVGGSSNSCVECADNFVKVTRNDGRSECVCGNKFKKFDSKEDACVWKDGGFSSESITKISDSFQGVSYSSSGLSLLFAVMSSFTKSGISMISNAFLLQKIFYMRLANVDKPYFFVEFLKSLDNGGILTKYNSWNIFKGIDSDAATLPTSSQSTSATADALAASNHSRIMNTLTSSSSDNITSNQSTQSGSQGELLMDYHFRDGELSAAIFVNVGGVFVAIIVILLVHLVFAFIVKNDTNSNAFYVYAMFICGSMVQMLPLIAFVLFDSFFMELTQISTVIDYYGVFSGIFLLLLIAVSMIFIFVSLGIVFAKGTTVNSNSREHMSEQSSSGFSMKLLMREVEMNLKRDTIQNKMIQRNYLIVFYAIECVVFPLITVMLRRSFYAAGIIGIVLQTSLFVFTVVVRPFYIKLINVQFALEQLFMLISYIVYLWLEFALDAMSIEEEEIPKGIVTLSMICLAFVLLAILVNPIMQIILLISVLRTTYWQRKKDTFTGRFTNKDLSLFSTIELMRKSNIEFPGRNKIQSDSTFIN